LQGRQCGRDRGHCIDVVVAIGFKRRATVKRGLAQQLASGHLRQAGKRLLYRCTRIAQIGADADIGDNALGCVRL